MGKFKVLHPSIATDNIIPIPSVSSLSTHFLAQVRCLTIRKAGVDVRALTGSRVMRTAN